jgi:hypothetical protein
MTRKHYVQFAELFRTEKPGDNWDANKRTQHNMLLKGMMEILKRDNPRFKESRFLDAAGGFAKE